MNLRLILSFPLSLAVKGDLVSQEALTSATAASYTTPSPPFPVTDSKDSASPGSMPRDVVNSRVSSPSDLSRAGKASYAGLQPPFVRRPSLSEPSFMKRFLILATLVQVGLVVFGS